MKDDADSRTTTWSQISTTERCKVLGRVAHSISNSADALVQLCQNEQRTDPVETITAELIPLCAAMKFLQKNGAKILRKRKNGFFGRPLWLVGVCSEVHRKPLGDVLILGAWNYPLLLAGVQAAQALAAGNRVLLKPAPGSELATQKMLDCFYDAGVPREQLRLLDSAVQAAVEAIENGVDLVVLTGSAQTGRKVMTSLAETLTPSIMELSGCDAVVVLPGADIQRVAAAIDFGLNFNGGSTCIGPRRLILGRESYDEIIPPIVQRLKLRGEAIVHPSARVAVSDAIQSAIDAGAVDLVGGFNADRVLRTGHMNPVLLDRVSPNDAIAQADLFAPVLSIIRADDTREKIRIVNQCPFRLAASVFGPSKQARHVAESLNTGSVIINDLIAPTADPNLPFGGTGQSGFGVTRGVEGLLAMTRPTVISQRRGRIAPHLDQRKESDAAMLGGALQWLHAGTMAKRFSGLRQMINSVKNKRSKSPD